MLVTTPLRRGAATGLLATWLIASSPFGARSARAGTLPVPAFTTPLADPFGITSVFNYAVPVLVDIDGDGDLDVFVGAFNKKIHFFRNTGTARSAAFAPDSVNPFGFPYQFAGSAPRFADLDGDGNLDAMIGDYLGTLWFLENTGTATSPSFAPPSSDPFGLASVSGAASPAFADIDGDGDLDAFVGTDAGDVVFARNVGNATSPAFGSPSTNPFGLANVGTYATPSFADLDGDGDLDALVENDDGVSTFFRNTGTAHSPAFAAGVTYPFGITYAGAGAAAAWGDIDGDGDLDLLVGNSSGHSYLFRNVQSAQPAPLFAPVQLNPYGLTTANPQTPRFADIDGDGDVDAFLSDGSGATFFFRNTGNLASPAFAAASSNPFGLSSVSSAHVVTFADVDGDGDLDALAGGTSGSTYLFRNTGTAVSPAFVFASANPFGLANVGADASPALADLDGDGDLDALVGNANGDLWFFRNTGSAIAPAFTFVSIDPFGLADVGVDAAPSFADLDGDGDLDVWVGTASGTVVGFRNSGSITSPAFVSAGNDPFGISAAGNTSSTPTFADIDGDGDLDAFLGTASGATVLVRNLTRQLVFEDGFESGGTGSWSSTSP